MPLSVGERLGPYEILTPIGAGGMGEVYRARDTRLDRIVAIKVSKQEFNERFEREARAIATLNHPHICQLYDVGPNYLVMEYVDGASLKGPLPLDQTLKYAAQICDALDAAHQRNITHRDLKPANILVTKSGIKLLDFGLAKVGTPLSAGEGTMTMALTAKGQILGTFQYMSPEQINGHEAGPPSDIFSFGLVLYEMLTGKRAFDGSTPASVIAAILERPTPSVADVAPPTLDRVLKRCLEKDPENRWQSARDLKSALELVIPAATEAKAAAAPLPVRPSMLPWPVPWIAAAACAMAALWLGYMLYTHGKEEPPGALKFIVPPPAKTRLGTFPFMAMSPNGQRVVFDAVEDGKAALWIRDLNSLDARRLAGTEDGIEPFWSPDSHTVAFFVAKKLKKIDIAGGPAITVCDTGGSPRGGTWAPGGKDEILFGVVNGGTFQVSAGGGTPAAVTKPDPAGGEVSHIWPWFLPDGRHFLYSVQATKEDKGGVYVADLESSKKKRVLPGVSNAMYAGGHLFFVRDGMLRAQSFNIEMLETSGEAVIIAQNVEDNDILGLYYFSTSQAGSLAYVARGSKVVTQLTWFDRSGKPLGTIGPFPEVFGWAALSPDGSSIALGIAEGGNPDLWLHDLIRGTTSRFTFGPKDNVAPIWSPDGRTVGFTSTRDGLYHPFQKSLDRGRDEVLSSAIGDPPHPTMPEDWSRDGRYVVERVIQTSNADDLWILPLFGDRKPFPYLQDQGNQRDGSISPDGKWLVYASDETGRTEVYVQTFPTPGGKVQISNSGGERPRWSRNGQEIYFIGPDLSMMAVPISAAAGTKFDAGHPKALFDSHIAGAFDDRFDVSTDGRFLIPTQAGQSNVTPLTVIVNWPSALKKN